MAVIAEAEVVLAVRALSRHKAPGTDGLRNGFYKYLQSLLVSPLVEIASKVLQGAQPPQSFMEALIIPLCKKEDSDDAMDYRPFSLLETGYKVIAKVLATRMKTCLTHVIGSSQQGFVRVSMMMAHLQSARAESNLLADASRAIVLLDFRKAYDTVDRYFMVEALRHFGFDEKFLALIQWLHTNTTARFSVNGELSSVRPVWSGICQR